MLQHVGIFCWEDALIHPGFDLVLWSVRVALPIFIKLENFSVSWMFLIVMSSLFVQVVSPDELKEENEYEEILEDMREECGRYGEFLKLIEVLVKASWPGKISFCQSNDFKSLSHCIQ